MVRYHSPPLTSSSEEFSPPFQPQPKRRLRSSDMEGISEFNKKMAAACPQLSVQEREALDELLDILGCHEPDLNLIAYTYHKLTRILHHSIHKLAETSSNTKALPRVCAFPTGSLLMGNPLTSPFKIVVFGSMSADNYYRLVWECMQNASEYEISASGVTEVQTAPVLKFVITFDGVAFDLQYHQCIPLIDEHYSESSTAAMLNTPPFFLDQNCTPQIRLALQDARRCAQQWAKFRSNTHLRHVYYIHRAWAIANGVFDDEMDSKIIRSLLQDYEHPDHVIFKELALAAPRTYLDLLPDQNWLALLQRWEEMPLSAKMVSSNYITINVTTNSSISGVESSDWLRHVEKRILEMKSRLERYGFTSFDFEEIPEPDSRFDSPSKALPTRATTELDPLFDPSKWNALSFEFSGVPLQAKIQHQETTVARLRNYKSPDPNLLLQELVPSIETPASELSEFEIPKLESTPDGVAPEAFTARGRGSFESLTLEPLKVDGDDKFSVGNIHAILQHKLKDKISLWPGRQELFKNPRKETADPTANLPDYEAYYVLGFKTRSKKDWDTVSNLVDRWTDEIRMHKTTKAGECFITPTLFTSIQYKQWETKNGWFRPSTRILSDRFLDNPLASSESDSHSLLSSKQRTRASKTSGTSSNSQQSGLETPSLRLSTDVLSRIRHDPAYDIDEYWIVYWDRHRGMVEIPARDWVGKEVSNEKFIPMRRIERFLRRRGGKEEVMWCKVDKIDRIFESGRTGEGGSENDGDIDGVGVRRRS